MHKILERQRILLQHQSRTVRLANPMGTKFIIIYPMHLMFFQKINCEQSEQIIELIYYHLLEILKVLLKLHILSFN